jgi:Tol biopolymer transport system component
MKLSSKIRTGLRLSVFFLFVTFLVPALASEPVRITSNPGEDFDPSISPDGSFMVYVSDTSGNLDLWLKYLGVGILPPDRRLTFHSTEDKNPAISPDGKKVAFVSHRGDPRGDIYVLDLQNIGEPVAVVQGKSEDMDPAWSVDQKFIFYASRATQISIFKTNMKSG